MFPISRKTNIYNNKDAENESYKHIHELPPSRLMFVNSNDTFKLGGKKK